MIELNSYQQGVAPASMAKLPTPVTFPEGMGCPRLRTEVSIEIKNGSGAAADYTFARAKKAIACLFGFITQWWGDRAKDIFDNAITFEQLRQFIIATTDDDVIIAGKRYGAYADADVIQANVAPGVSFLLTAEVPRPFELTRLGRDAALWAPGWTQMGMLHSEIKRLGAADFDTNGVFQQNRAADFIMLADTVTGHEDNWANVPRMYVNKEIGKLNHAPAGELAMLSICERTKTGVQTIAREAGTLGLFSIRRVGEAAVHDNVQAARVATDAMYGVLPGGQDLNLLATPLHHLPQAVDPNDIPTGAGWLIEMPGAEIAGGAEIAYVYLPAFDDSYAETLVKPNLVGDEQGKPARVKLTNSLAKQGRSITSKLATFAPRAILREDDPAYVEVPGDVADKGAPKLIPAVPKQATDAVKAGGLAARKGLSKFLTGTTSAIRGRRPAKFGIL